MTSDELGPQLAARLATFWHEEPHPDDLIIRAFQQYKSDAFAWFSSRSLGAVGSWILASKATAQGLSVDGPFQLVPIQARVRRPSAQDVHIVKSLFLRTSADSALYRIILGTVGEYVQRITRETDHSSFVVDIMDSEVGRSFLTNDPVPAGVGDHTGESNDAIWSDRLNVTTTDNAVYSVLLSDQG